MQTKYITDFRFDHAVYQLSDGKGDMVFFHVNYKENTFHVQSLTEVEHKKFRSEIATIAKDLLARKHNVNFAEKEITRGERDHQEA